MAIHSITARAASALPVVGIVLAAANWYVRPQAALAWTAAVAMLVVMVVVLRRSRLASRRSAEDATALRSLASVTSSVAFGALLLIIPLSMTLAHAYGVVDDPDGGRRASMLILGAYFMAIGNVMPRMLPPLSSMQCDGARIQAFQRLAGWTWVLCGLGFLMAWLALPVDAAEPVSMALVVTAMVVTIGQLLRLRKPRRSDPLRH